MKTYLTTQATGNKIQSFSKLFERFSVKKSLIINFNYTNVPSLYGTNDIIHLHGELNNPSNKIIFGYAANAKECEELSLKTDAQGNYEKEYLKNIKRFCYNRNHNSKYKLDEFLFPLDETEKSEKISVLLVGSSLGISDKLILEQVLNHPNVEKIVPLFYKKDDFNNYSDLQENAYRIMNNDELFDKRFKGIDQSFQMPQIGETLDDTSNFEVFLNKFIQTKPFTSFSIL